MDKRNNNIEDFFNKSLEQFSDAPSDSVWAGIDLQLGAEKIPFYKKWKFWIATFTSGLAVCLLTYGFIATQNSIDLLTLKTEQLVAENNQLKLALNNYGENNAELITQQEVRPEVNNPIIEIGSNEPSASTPLQREEAKQRTSLSYTSSYFEAFNNSVFSKFKTGNNLNFSNSTVLLSDGSFKENRTASTILNSTAVSTNNLKEDSEEEDAAILELMKNELRPSLKLASADIREKIIPLNKKRNLPSTFKKFEIYNIVQPKRNKLDYRIGIGFGFKNTFTERNDLLGPGYNIGITNELKITNSFSLTAELHYNKQSYEIKLNNEDQNLLLDYPVVEEITNVVTSINQQADYLEFPLGFKWISNTNNNGTKFFINPSAAWQFYFLQQFEYELATSNGIITKAYTSEQYFGYFGTIQMQLGFERSLSNNLNYQLGLWAEKSLTPLGVENRNLFNIGIRGAILLD